MAYICGTRYEYKTRLANLPLESQEIDRQRQLDTAIDVNNHFASQPIIST